MSNNSTNLSNNTLFNSIEFEIKELFKEIPKNYKQKLSSIQESIKLLKNKINSENNQKNNKQNLLNENNQNNSNNDNNNNYIEQLKNLYNEEHNRYLLLEKKYKNLDSKFNYNSLKKLYEDLKLKCIEYENILKQNKIEIGNLIKKNNNLNEKLKNEIIKNQELTNNIINKESRLKAIRFMNNKLEKKSNALIQQFNNINQIEKNHQELINENNYYNQNYQKSQQILNEEILKNNQLIESNKILKNKNEFLYEELFKLQQENQNLKDLNKQIVNNNVILENTFKSQIRNSNENLNNLLIESNSFN